MEQYTRQSFLGADAQEIFSECTIAIIGLGGGGSHVAQQAAHVGIGRIQLYDPDKVEFSNLNRLIGASYSDAERGALKVDVAKQLILALNPKMYVEAYPSLWQLSPETIKDADVIISCVDSYSARQDIEATSRRYLIPLIDMGMDVHLVNGKPHISGQVILSLPNGPCLRCMGFLNEENLKREADQYGDAGARPQVVWSNGVLASIAVGLLADLLAGWNGLPAKGEYLHFDGNSNRVWRSPRLEYAAETCAHFPSELVGEPVFK